MLTNEVRTKIAQYLLDCEAVRLNIENPFTWTSGLRSPVYCDNRVTLSYPAIRKYITEKLAETIREHFPDTQAIAGVATAGIPQGALIADMLGLPFAYVRPEPKKHGMKNSIEGRLDEGARVAVVEDLISTGKSSLKAVDVLKESGFHVAGLVSIFNYGFPETHKRFQDAGCAYVSLCDFNTLAEEAENSGKISKEQLKKIEEWSSDPAGWSSKGDGQFWV